MTKIQYNRFVDKHGQEYINKLYTLSVGDILEFGAYEQDNNASNGKETIEWLVLAKEDNKILVTSKYALDCKKYNTTYNSVTWKSCTLRKWLNNDFLNYAFTKEERAVISKERVSADKNSEYNTKPGNATRDNIFLLSIAEAEKYFTTDEARKCVPTPYAIAQGAATSEGNISKGKATCWWWLRTLGDNQLYDASVSSAGSIYYYGYKVDYDDISVRPAMWITLAP